jgi:hypothetical protein
MNNYWLPALLLLLCCKIATAQKIQYSKGSLRAPGAGNIQLVANVNGYHHLIYFSVGKKPLVHVFNAQLQLLASRELNMKLQENVDISIIQLNDFYLLYAHTLDPSHHQVLKVKGDGTLSDLSHLFQNPVDSLWNKSKATFQLFDHNNQIYLIAHSYHEQFKQIKSIVVKLNPDGPARFVSQLIFPFDAGTDELNQVTLNNDQLMVLKTTKDEEEKNTLTLIKIHLFKGTTISKKFESGRYIPYSPVLRYNIADSSILVFSMLNAPPGYTASSPGVFIASLDNSLNELAPIRTITSPFRDNTISSFYVEKNKTTGWMNFSSMRYSGSTGKRLYDYQIVTSEFSNTSPLSLSYSNIFPTTRLDIPTAVRMIVLNNRLQNERDSLVKNNGRYYKLHPWSHAQFVLQNKAYLLMVHELTAKRKGLVLIYPTEHGDIESLPLRVHHQFNFLLPLAKTAEDYFIVPFTNKKEMGLMKVTLNR